MGSMMGMCLFRVRSLILGQNQIELLFLAAVKQLTPNEISIAELGHWLQSGDEVELGEVCRQKIVKCREYLDNRLSQGDEAIYGVNTGFGSLHDKSIAEEDLVQLQLNLIRSHACGMGDELSPEIVRIMLLLKARGLSYGHSGVQLKTVQRLLDFYNAGITPVVYQQGSLGASGDLAPLAHLAMSLIGEGQVRVNGELRSTKDVLEEKGWTPIKLKSKEGLALLNGTQFMSAIGVFCLLESTKIQNWANLVGSMSLEAFDGRVEPFGKEVNEVRKQPGQIAVAGEMRNILIGSEIVAQHKTHVQDPYSFRCIPQVHGASRQSIAHVAEIFENEINAVTDNPTIFPDQNLIVSAGNFHGQPLALAFDQLAIALAELGSISERRTYKLISGQRGLPAFLVANPGLNSGFMIPQYTAASIVSQNKSLCTPASVDTIDSSNGQEDHVSMGANGATRTLRVVENVQRILAIELMNSAQGLEFRRPLQSSPSIENLHRELRTVVPAVDNDEYLHPLLTRCEEFIQKRNPQEFSSK